MRINTKLTTYEICTLTIIFIGIKLTDTTPSLLSDSTQNAFWYIPLISFIVMFPFFLITLYLLNKYKADHLVDLLQILLGKTLGKALAFFIFIFSFFLSAFDFRSYVNQIELMYFDKSSITIIFALLIFISIFGAIRGIKVIGYTAKVFFPLFQISLALLVILVYPSLVFERIYPIFGSGLSNVMYEGIFKGSFFSSFILLMMILPVARKPENFYKGTIMGLIISVLQIVFLFLIYATFFDYKSIERVPYPFHDVALYIDLGSFFTNIETFFMTFWLFAVFIRFILLLYLNTWLFGATFDIDNFELLILPMGFLIMVIGLIPDNIIVNEFIYRNHLLNLNTIFLFIVPVILLICHFFKRKKV